LQQVLKALEDGKTLIEVEFPTASLSSVAGDAEGANEMNFSLAFLRQFCRAFQDRASTTRIFFPDAKELEVARQGTSVDPNAADAWSTDPQFAQTRFQLDFLTRPNGLLDIGINIGGSNPSENVQDSDELFIMAYPSFDPREMMAVDRLWRASAKDSGRPIVLFNAEIDRIRSGYYPPLFYPGIGRLAKELIPLIEPAYYLHNFKGRGGGALFRAYPGPWQVYFRSPDQMILVHEQDDMPSLKQVALEILPRAVKGR
jgi:hypothetical protein